MIKGIDGPRCESNQENHAQDRELCGRGLVSGGIRGAECRLMGRTYGRIYRTNRYRGLGAGAMLELQVGPEVAHSNAKCGEGWASAQPRVKGLRGTLNTLRDGEKG